MVGLENVFYMPVAMAVTPDPVQMSVATEVKPSMCPYKNITVMVAERVQRFVMFRFMQWGRWRGFRLWGSFNARQTHDTSQGYNSSEKSRDVKCTSRLTI